MENNIEYVVIKSIVFLYEDKQHKKSFEVMEEVREEYFNDSSCKKIFRALKNLLKSEKPLDATTVLHNLDKSEVPLFTKIISIPVDVIRVKRYIGMLEDLYKKRLIKKAINKALQGLDSSLIDNPPESILNALKSNLEQIEIIKNSEIIEMNEALYESWADLEESSRKDNLIELEKWKTGILGLDNLMGGLRKKQLTLIGAHSGVGKTALALQIGLNLTRNGLKGLIVSKEMGTKELIRRMVSQVKKIDSNKFKWLDLNEGDWKNILDGHNQLSNHRFIFDTTSQNVSDIERWIKRIKPDFTIIDYIQLLAPENKGDNREQQLSAISRGLKRIAMAEDTSIILLTQLNENEATGRPSERSIRESRAPYFDSDNVIFIYNPKPEQLLKLVEERYNYLKINDSILEYAREQKMDFVEIILDKQRNGATGAFMATNKKPFYLFETIGGNHVK